MDAMGFIANFVFGLSCAVTMVCTAQSIAPQLVSTNVNLVAFDPISRAKLLVSNDSLSNSTLVIVGKDSQRITHHFNTSIEQIDAFSAHGTLILKTKKVHPYLQLVHFSWHNNEFQWQLINPIPMEMNSSYSIRTVGQDSIDLLELSDGQLKLYKIRPKSLTAVNYNSRVIRAYKDIFSIQLLQNSHGFILFGKTRRKSLPRISFFNDDGDCLAQVYSPYKTELAIFSSDSINYLIGFLDKSRFRYSLYAFNNDKLLLLNSGRGILNSISTFDADIYAIISSDTLITYYVPGTNLTLDLPRLDLYKFSY